MEKEKIKFKEIEYIEIGTRVDEPTWPTILSLAELNEVLEDLKNRNNE